MTDEIVESVANQIHGETCDCDDKHCTTRGDIADWLHDGCYQVRPYTIEELVAEWNEREQQE